MSSAHQGSHKLVSFWYKEPHILAKNHTCRNIKDEEEIGTSPSYWKPLY